MAETFVHKDGKSINVDVEYAMRVLCVSRETAVWWMTQLPRSSDSAKEELKRLAEDENHSDREHIAAMSAFCVKQRLTS